MNSIDRLIDIFKHFPGIGPRQARRFVYFLINQKPGFIKSLAQALLNLSEDTVRCSLCQKNTTKDRVSRQNNEICFDCADGSRDRTKLLVVEKDIDLSNFRKSDIYNGHYFVLGGLLKILEKEPEQVIRVFELKKRITEEKELSEIIIALSANPTGDHTAEYLKEKIREWSPNLTVTFLGRGLSTGTELEYSDSDTIFNALKNRA